MDKQQRLVGQFLQGDIKKVKSPNRNSVSVYGNNVSNYGLYKINGMVFKKGAAGSDYRH
jgi:hypothetical protein